jgi:hypothetical protein
MDKRVESKWWRTLDLPLASNQILPESVIPPEPTLDEITPKQEKTKNIENKISPSSRNVRTKNSE